MGVDRTDYIMFGWKLPYEIKNSKGVELDLWDDKYLPMIEGHTDERFSIIRDGMSGEYMVFGLSLGNSEIYTGWEFTSLKLDKLDPEELKTKYREVFDLDEKEIIAEPYLFIFSHYS